MRTEKLCSPASSEKHLLPIVLVVEDDPGVLMGIESALARAGYVGIPIGSAEEGLAYLDEFMPGLVLTGCHLVGMDGVEFLRCVKYRFPGLPVVGASTEASNREKILAAGGDRFLQKPFEVQELIATVEELAVKWYLNRADKH